MRRTQKLRVAYDVEIDALYLKLASSKVVESDEMQPGIIVDFNARNQIVGIEVLDLKRRVRKADLKQLKLLIA